MVKAVGMTAVMTILISMNIQKPIPVKVVGGCGGGGGGGGSRDGDELWVETF